MRIDIITLFPEMFAGPFGQSMMKRAIEKGLLDVRLTQLRDFTFDKHHMADDTPFGGGDGMVLKPEPIFRAVGHVTEDTQECSKRVLLMCPGGQAFTQEKAKELARYEQLVLVCGHYEGFDARVTNFLADESLSIGDYVLTGGELPAMVVVDAIARMIPGVLGSEGSAQTDSFYDGLLGYPQYTRPREFEGLCVPEVLLSGHHVNIARWRRRESLRATRRNRPDLLEQAEIGDEDRKLLAEIEAEEGGDS